MTVNHTGEMEVSILIVEDDYFIGQDLEATLLELGYRVLGIAASLKEAKQILDEYSPDLVILDYQLGEKERGTQLAMEVLNPRSIPFLFLTSYTKGAFLEEAKQTKPYGYLSKPVNKEDLFNAIELARYKAENEDIKKEKRLKENLLSTCQSIVNIQDRQQLFDIILERFQHSLSFDGIGGFLFDENMKTATYFSIKGLAEMNGWRFTIHKSNLGTLINSLNKHNNPLIIDKPMMMKVFGEDISSSSLTMYQQGCFNLMKVGGKIVGLISLFYKQNTSSSNDDLNLFKALSDLFAIALANVHAHEKIKLREQEETLKSSLIYSLNQENDWETKLKEIALLLRPFIPFRLIYFWLGAAPLRIGFERIGPNELRILDNQKLARIGAIPFKAFEVAMQEHFRTLPFEIESAPILAQQYRKDPITRFWADKFNLNSRINFPVLKGSKKESCICFFSEKSIGFQPQHLQLLQVIGPYFSIALENQLHHHEVLLANERKAQENAYLAEEIKANYNFGEIIGKSAPIQSVFEAIRQVAPTQSNVLITGETGTGKELVARALHSNSNRSKENFIKLNCAALPSELIESELFGHEKGAFTGAIQKRIGKFELANKGTIFLDEIGELPLELQVKILRVLQEKEFERLGGNQVIKTNARVIAATNRDLREEMHQGNFREDLYYRINVFPIHIPPLRNRLEDIKPLILHFISKHSKRIGRSGFKLDQSALSTLQQYHWPGNIRELEHTIERAMITSKTKNLSFNSDQFIAKTKKEDSESSLPITYREAEIKLIVNTLKLTQGKISGKGGAAEMLDIHPSTLESKMRKFGIKRQFIIDSDW